MTPDPLVVRFDVAASPAHAFAMWTARTASWWPRSHTVSGDPARITFEPWPGGAIFEQTTDGTVHPWGEILAWDPPGRLCYRWHLFFDPSQATEVEVTFEPHGDGTAVQLVQRGFDRLGEAAGPRRDRTNRAWATIAPQFARACATADGDGDGDVRHRS
jgi:uncharacterized protein YndB with AHSA1/START domain